MIKGLKPRLAEAGKVKIGGRGAERTARSGATWRPPIKQDHFTITTTQREGGDPNADLVVNTDLMGGLVNAGYADPDGKIRRVPVMLRSNEIDEVFPTRLVLYQGKLCACSGDGETATRYEIVDGKRTGRTKDVECPCEFHEKDRNGSRRCKFNGILHCSIWLPGFAMVGAIYKWRTTSEISVNHMIASLRDVLAAAGALRDIPLILHVVPETVTPAGKPITVYVCHVRLEQQIAEAQATAIEAAQRRAELAGDRLADLEIGYRETLQLPGAESDEEQADVAEEFYPEVVDASGATIAQPPHDLTPEQQQALQSPTATPAPEKPGYPDNMQPINNPGPSPTEPQKRTRKTRCKECGELFGPGIVKNGLCEGCRQPQVPDAPPEQPPQQEQPATAPEQPAEPDPAPEIVTQPPARPSTATTDAPPSDGRKEIELMVRDAFGAGKAPTAVLEALRSKWSDADDRDWTALELAAAQELINAVSS